MIICLTVRAPPKDEGVELVRSHRTGRWKDSTNSWAGCFFGTEIVFEKSAVTSSQVGRLPGFIPEAKEVPHINWKAGLYAL